MLPLMSYFLKAGIVLLLVSACRAGAEAETPSEPPGFVEFIESDIVPMIVETGGVPAAAGAWPVEPPAEAPIEPPAQPEPGAAQPAGESEPPPPRRDPFWPVGYAPPVPVRPSEGGEAATNAEPVSVTWEWDAALKTVAVQGILKTGPDTHVAMVNGEVVGTNDHVSIRFGGREYRWRVAAVSEQGVSFVRVEPEPPEPDTGPRTNAN